MKDKWEIHPKYRIYREKHALTINLIFLTGRFNAKYKSNNPRQCQQTVQQTVQQK